MSDNFSVKRYRRQTVSVIGVNRNRKYLIIFVLLLTAGIAGVGYLVYSSGIFTTDNPQLAPHLAQRINLERQVNNLPPVQGDSSLSYLAYTKSQEVKISQLNYAKGASTNPDASTNVIIIPKMTWALSGNDFQQQFSDSVENGDSAFLKNVLNPNYQKIGIGVSSDSYNYYIVTKWKES